MQTVLNIQELSAGRREPIISGISSQLMQGRLVVLTGNNGSGKSTLLRTLAGIIRPVSGSIIFADGSGHLSGAPALSRLLSFAGTERIKEDYICVEDLVRFGQYPYSRTMNSEERNVRVLAAMDRMGITAIRHKYLDRISDGEWQKANIARALAQQTPLILLDEPSAFLDFPSRINLFRDLERLCLEDGKTVIVSTHDVEMANRHGHVFWHLSEGAFIESDKPVFWEV